MGGKEEGREGGGKRERDGESQTRQTCSTYERTCWNQENPGALLSSPRRFWPLLSGGRRGFSKGTGLDSSAVLLFLTVEASPHQTGKKNVRYPVFSSLSKLSKGRRHSSPRKAIQSSVEVNLAHRLRNSSQPELNRLPHPKHWQKPCCYLATNKVQTATAASPLMPLLSKETSELFLFLFLAQLSSR